MSPTHHKTNFLKSSVFGRCVDCLEAFIDPGTGLLRALYVEESCCRTT
jgi:hypothetical protein